MQPQQTPTGTPFSLAPSDPGMDWLHQLPPKTTPLSLNKPFPLTPYSPLDIDTPPSTQPPVKTPQGDVLEDYLSKIQDDAFLTTFLFKAILKHFWHSTHFNSLTGCKVVLYELCDAFVSKWPSYGKVHNVVYCYAYFCLQWHYRRHKGWSVDFLEGGA